MIINCQVGHIVSDQMQLIGTKRRSRGRLLLPCWSPSVGIHLREL